MSVSVGFIPQTSRPSPGTLPKAVQSKHLQAPPRTASSGGGAKLPLFLSISPPARWGLLDFMSVDFRRLLPPSAAFRLLRTSTTTIHAKCSLPDLNRENPRQVFPARPQPRESTPSVPCRTSTATIHAQCSLPDLNRDHPRPVFPAGPQPRESTPSVPCRTSTAGENAKRYAR